MTYRLFMHTIFAAVFALIGYTVANDVERETTYEVRRK